MGHSDIYILIHFYNCNVKWIWCISNKINDGYKDLAALTLNNLSFDATFFSRQCGVQELSDMHTLYARKPCQLNNYMEWGCVCVLCQCLKHTLTSHWHYLCILALIGNQVLNKTMNVFFFTTFLPQSLIKLPKSTLFMNMKSSWKLLFADARPAINFQRMKHVFWPCDSAEKESGNIVSGRKYSLS